MIAEMNLGVAMRCDELFIAIDLTNGNVINKWQIFQFKASKSRVAHGDFVNASNGVIQNLQG